jgi:glycosyltransferase involved in cell wall biosynthesis
MKVLHIVEHYLPFLGGVEVNTHEIAKRLVRDGFEVEVVCEREKGTMEYEVLDGVRVHRVFNLRLVKLKYDIGRIAPKMLLSTARNDADIIHAHAYGYFPTYASFFSGKPTVITTHSDPTDKIFPFWDLSRSIPLKLSDRVIATTEMERLHLIKRGVSAKKITVISNGITLPRLKMPQIENQNKIILCLARLDIAHKGQDILFHAMPKVITKVPDAKLWVVGTGEDLSALKKLSDRLKINKYVEFKGGIGKPDKFLFLQNSQVLCVSPRTESFGVVYLEAMAYGLPIVTTSVGGVPEVVGDSAIIVPPNDPSALADALIKVLTDENIAANLSEKGLNRVKRFDWECLVDKYEELYEQLLI